MNNSQELIHTKSSIYFCEILLRYHLSQLHHLFVKSDVHLETFLTSWIMTLFSKFVSIIINIKCKITSFHEKTKEEQN